MHKTVSSLLIALGAILIAGALAFTVKNILEAEQAHQAAQTDLEALQAVIVPTASETTPAETASLPQETEPTEPPHPEVMAEEIVNGRAYIGYLSIPALELELPVLSKWSYPDLQVSPCRHQGTTWGDDLVIAAHNYPKHFGHLHKLAEGDTVTFTDMEGNVTDYTAGIVTTIQPYEEQKVLDGSWDLVLYTCTPGGQMRVMAGFDRSKPDAPRETAPRETR